MKTKAILAILCLAGSLASVHAQLNIPAADGTDGAFSPLANVEIDLSQATLGDGVNVKWDSPNNGNAGNGIYDPIKWAVVFKYSSVNIPAGVTVTFKNRASRAPVVWLVQNGVTITGTVNLNGKNSFLGTDLVPNEPGPGGFRGGAGSVQLGFGAGLGPGGGTNQGGFSSNGNYSAPSGNTPYGNTPIFPLIGGSGGASRLNTQAAAGGGGAIMIAARGTIQFVSPGSIIALGGTGTDQNGNPNGSYSYSAGAGGAIKLVANAVTGTGTANAMSNGRVRVEANSMPSSISTTPQTIAVPPGNTPTLFPSDTSPSCRVLSVDNAVTPMDPNAPLNNDIADVGINKSTPVKIVVETRKFATSGGKVTVRIAPKYGNGTVTSYDILAPVAGGTTELSTWEVNATLPGGYCTIQARATQP